jgi:hypothetical protein
MEAFPLFERARHSAPDSRFAGLASWAMANCLFNENYYSAALPVYRQAALNLTDRSLRLEVEFGIALAQWITEQTTETGEFLVAFGGQHLPDKLRNRWRLAVAVRYRQIGCLENATDHLNAIAYDVGPQDIWIDAVCERALCAIGQHDQMALKEALVQFEHHEREASDRSKWLIWYLNRYCHGDTHEIYLPPPIEHEGYERRWTWLTALLRDTRVVPK